jgi:hypothetical protein
VLAFILSKTYMGRNMHNTRIGLEALAGIDVPKFDFWGWVGKTFTPSYQEEIDQHFKNCTDHADVERIMANLQRRGML